MPILIGNAILLQQKNAVAKQHCIKEITELSY